MRKQCEFQNVVADTLLIPLYMRAKENQRRNPILKDDVAVRLVEKIDFDSSTFNNAKLSELGCVVRGWYFDNAVRRFISCRKNAVVVNVGCGLDTRYQRIVGEDDAVFYELDLPEVISIRRQLIAESERDRYISASLLEVDWMDDLRQAHPDSSFIFIVEGVLMYFYENQVKSFLQNVADRFGGGEIWFDVCGTMMSKHGVKPDSLRKHSAQIRSGISDGHLPEQWVPSLKLIEQVNYMKFFRRRWGFLFGQVLGRMTWLCYLFSSMLGYKILQKQ